MKKLLGHFQAMQTKATAWLAPGSYIDLNDNEYTEADEPKKSNAFIADMIYMLDGPEQREAEAEASFDYVAETDVTASNVYGGENSDGHLLCEDLETFIEAAKRLDKHKKVLFRKRSNADAGLPEPGPYRTSVLFNGVDMELLHGIVGVATEAGELAEIAHRRLYNNSYLSPNPEPFDVTNVREEIGDVLWYLARLVKWSGTTFLAEMMRNIAKLRKRHGGSFNAERDANRDLDAERVLLEGGEVYDPRKDDEYGFTVADSPTFDEEQVAAAAEKALADAERVKTQAVDFPDEMTNGVDPMPGKHSDGN